MLMRRTQLYQLLELYMLKRQVVPCCIEKIRTLVSTPVSLAIPHTVKGQASSEQNASVDRIRNIGVMAHVDAGKTTTTEKILYLAGRTQHMGNVDRGDTVTDFMDQERERGITIQSAAVSFPWNDHTINLIDTPGHVDFTVEVERCLRVLDGGVIVLDASAGVEAQTLTVWRQARKFGLPCIALLNKMDKKGASVEKCLKSIQRQMGIRPLLLHHYIGPSMLVGQSQGTNYGTTIYDLISQTEYKWNSYKDPRDVSVTYEVDKYVQERNALLEEICEVDDVFAEKYLQTLGEATKSGEAQKSLSAVEVQNVVRSLCRIGKVLPVLCGSALKNIGVQLLLDAVVDYLPSPCEDHTTQQLLEALGGDTKSLRNPQPNELNGLVFKIKHDRHKGVLCFVRIYTGILRTGDTFYNLTHECSEKVNGLFVPYADDLIEVPRLMPGSIGVVGNLRHSRTGDALVKSQSIAEKLERHYAEVHVLDSVEHDHTKAVRFEPLFRSIDIPEPVFFCSIEPPSMRKQKEFDYALLCLQREDPSLRVRIDEESNETILEGMGELHIEVIKHRLKHEFDLDVYIGPLQINYRESLYTPVAHSTTMEDTIDGKRQIVTIGLKLEPHEGAGRFKRFKFVNTPGEIPLSSLRSDWLKSIREGFINGMRCGPLIGAQVQDIDIYLTGFQANRSISAPIIAACAEKCLQDALLKADSRILEPIMQLDIALTSRDYLSSVLADLSKRRAEIKHLDTAGDAVAEATINAIVPLEQLVGYVNVLRSLSSGTGSFHSKLIGYRSLDPAVEKVVLDRISGKV